LYLLLIFFICLWRAHPANAVFGSFACPKEPSNEHKTCEQNLDIASSAKPNAAKKTAPNRAKGELGVAKIPNSEKISYGRIYFFSGAW
jgi:anti-sigma factor ChrR (cupin superfamily)